jgi:exonuclease VII small subunit
MELEDVRVDWDYRKAHRQVAKRKASKVGKASIEELRGYEEALSAELEALMATLSNRKSMSPEEFERSMSWAHQLETRLQSVQWDIERHRKTSMPSQLYLWPKDRWGTSSTSRRRRTPHPGAP